MTLGADTSVFASSEISCSSTMCFVAMPDKNLTCPADFFFGSYGEINLGIRNFLFDTFGGSLLGSRSSSCGEGVELNAGGDCVDCGVERSWRGDGWWTRKTWRGDSGGSGIDWGGEGDGLGRGSTWADDSWWVASLERVVVAPSVARPSEAKGWNCLSPIRVSQCPHDQGCLESRPRIVGPR